MAAEHDQHVSRVMKAYAERKSGHHQFCQQVADRYRAYYGLIDEQQAHRPGGIANWNSRLTPPYAEQVVEGVVANLIDDRTRFQVRPRPRMASDEEIRKATEGARALEILLSYQLDLDRFAEKQRAFVLQNCIAGLTVAKCYWRTELGVRRSLVGRDEDVQDDYGNVVARRRVLEEQKVDDVLYDGPCFDVVRVEDFLWEEAATKLEDARWVIHRTAATLDELKQLEKAGVYRNVSQLEDRDMRESFSDETPSVQSELSGDKRFKDRHEILEMWYRDGGKVMSVTVADRAVLLAGPRENPFWHGQFPFVVCSTAPDMFRIPGRSLVEKIRHIQEGIWTLLNQTFDNIQLINNAMYVIRQDLLDRDAIEFYPGAFIPSEGDPRESVMQLSPDPMVAQISGPMEARLKGDMQNITGGMPFMAGVGTQELDQKTATGVSIVTNIAQRMVMAQKQQLAFAHERVADQFVAMDRQFLRDPVLVQIVGADGAVSFRGIDPEEIQGFDYHVNVTATTESLMRQERRAESTALLQIMAQVAAPMAVIAQGDPSKRTINLEAFVEDVLREYDKDDFERYFSVRPQMLQQAGAPAQNGNGQPSPGGDPMGVTSPAAYDSSSPSSQVSLSPEVFMQRYGAQQGAPGGVA